MVVRSSAVVIMSALTVSAFAAAESATELPPLIGRPVSLSVVKAGQLALAPGGNRAALADRFANRIYVFDSNGEVLWSVGDGIMLAQPTALVWTSDRELMFSQWDSRALCRVTEEDPARIDTVADLSVVLGDKGRILRLYQRRDRTFLALTEKPDGLRHLDIEWKQVRVLVPGGSGRGKIGRASVCAQLASGRLAIIGERTFPVQIFDADGKLLLSGDWNQPSLRSVWEATAATVDTRDVIWVADATNSQFRRYDQTGTLLDTRLFGTPGARPVGMVATADYKLIVVNETGRVDIYDLSQEQ
ncbi:MAG: hypothetical protein NTW07_13225 [candidate division Zixibacteria bacterium]|nr:hypothetical protein [candidate division Zixibacteria bacterium]